MNNNNRDAYSRKEVVDIIKVVRDKLDERMHSNDPNVPIYNGLKDLLNHIERMREDIGMLNPGEISDTHIPSATDELDAVIGATEEATNKIMDSCDAIQEEVGKSDISGKARVEQSVMDIYEACSFQDITGQRIAKVVNSLKHIEHKVEGMLSALNGQVFEQENTAKPIEEKVSVDNEASLLNGPALEGASNSVDQEEIDRLLAEFD